MTIKIQGTIVSPDYDDAFFGAWIDKGVITPSSRVVSAIEGAEEPIDLYINSYGGDVFAGGEMMIALVKAQAAGKLRTVEVGSLAASMAANIVAALKANGGKVTAHANTQLMYHGCYTVAEGGAQHLEDTAESLRSINEAVISNLNRIGITECRAWFAEGREKWLDAAEARKLGIVDEVAEDGAENPPEMRQTAARLAALATHFTTRQEYKLMIDESVKPVAEEPAPAPEAAPVEEPKSEDPTSAPAEEKPAEPVNEPEPAPAEEAPAPTEAEIEERVQKLVQERFAGLQSKSDKKISDLTKERDTARADLATAKAEATSLRAEVEKLTADLAQVRDQLAESERNREAVVASALTPTQPKTADGKSARQTLAALPPSKRAEYYKAHRAEIDGTK
ncbi:MAG: ATP-dependent Clp protease proteolytic subunit [Kiritimatiellae bacterium]|nr:ATP-dependent Clp protease proteolytic subunit [Kiritimatiellia bacterium]